MEPTPGRRAVVYARISVAQEASVSVARQIEAAEQYAAARGWQVVATFTDEGVSATHNKPEDRPGWRALLDSTDTYDAVLVWKIDRLARRVLDFLHADEALQQRGAGIVAVEDPVDMTTAQGQAFATMLAVFGQMEAESIRARVAAARTHLLKAGRVVGGTVPYGWRSLPNPDGAGYVLAHDPDRIDYVRGMADRTLAGNSIYSTVQWLDSIGAPTPTGKGGWQYSTVERILRHPGLAGMTPFNPGNETKVRGTGVLRDGDGLPVVDESVAIMPVAEWRAMVAALDNRKGGRSTPRAQRASTSGLLSGLVWCAEHDTPVRMHRGTTQGRPGYSCPQCHQTISNFEDVVIEHFLWAKGPHVRWTPVHEVHEGGAAMLPEIAHRLDELNDLIRNEKDPAKKASLRKDRDRLEDLEQEKRAQTPTVTQRWEPTQHFGADWAAAATVEDRRAVLDDALERLHVRRGKRGRRTTAGVLARLQFDWKDPDRVGPVEAPDDDTLASN